MCLVFVCDEDERVVGRQPAPGACPYCGGMIQAMDVESQWRFAILVISSSESSSALGMASCAAGAIGSSLIFAALAVHLAVTSGSGGGSKMKLDEFRVAKDSAKGKALGPNNVTTPILLWLLQLLLFCFVSVCCCVCVSDLGCFLKALVGPEFATIINSVLPRLLLDHATKANKGLRKSPLCLIDHLTKHTKGYSQVVVLDSDDEVTEDRKPFNSYQQIILPKPSGEFLRKDFLMKDFLVIAFYTSEL
ncbi:hypothetical protein RHGRI_013835 [Rhododendron griersonianum]|uniref:Uncharacterized protein n=1 Tax=Rhododendron griersonianum TaxID=479676 RepID=A0AAV6K7H1_9ERIC|nr:hypothetical protein RHGRI_013835 [Rhododendron griersonianum]